MAILLLNGCRSKPPDISQVGGTVLVFDVESEDWETADPDERTALLVAVRKRVDPHGTQGILSDIDRDGRLTVSIPGRDEALVKRTTMLLGSPAQLELLVVANKADHERLIELARASDKRLVRDGEKSVGRWVTIKRNDDELRALAVIPMGLVLRDSDTKKPVELPEELLNKIDTEGIVVARWLADQHIADLETLVVLDRNPRLNVKGNHFSRIQSDLDEQSMPCITFEMTSEGASLLRLLSSTHLPERNTGHFYQLGIIFDGELISAPRIQSEIGDRGRITGQFTSKEVDVMVATLRAGGFPFPLSKAPVTVKHVEKK